MRTELQRRKYIAALDDSLGSEDSHTSDDVDGGDLDPDEIDIDDTLGRVEDGPGGSDTSAPNGTSIAALAEYDDMTP